MTRFRFFLCKVAALAFALFILFILGSGKSLGQAGSSISLPTDLRLQNSGWWPRRADAPHDAYVGGATCGKCHGARAETQANTAMAHASSLVKDSESLRQNPDLMFKLGDYSYEL